MPKVLSALAAVVLYLAILAAPASAELGVQETPATDPTPTTAVIPAPGEAIYEYWEPPTAATETQSTPKPVVDTSTVKRSAQVDPQPVGNPPEGTSATTAPAIVVEPAPGEPIYEEYTPPSTAAVPAAVKTPRATSSRQPATLPATGSSILELVALAAVCLGGGTLIHFASRRRHDQ